MKKILISICLFTVWITSYSQINCNGTSASTVNPTDKLAICNGNLQRTVTASQLVDAAIDTTKVGRIEQGRGTAPIFMYFNGVAWVRNDTSYVPQSGTNKFSGNLLSNQSFLQVGLGSSNNTLTFTDEVFTGIKSASATSETQISAYSTTNGYADISVYNPLGGLYDRRMVITGTGNNTPDQSFRIQNGLLYYFGNYTSQMTDDRTVPDIGKVKQLISDSIGTVQSTTLADGKIWIGDGTDTAFPRTLSGDVTVSNLGVTTIANGAVTNAKLANSTISGVSLGSNLNDLTISTGLSLNSGSTYNGSTARTITNNVLTGVSGGQTWVGSTSTNSGVTYKTTTGIGATGADHIFQVGNNGATEAMRIINSGNVGIGVATPLYKLDVAETNEGIHISSTSADEGAWLRGSVFATGLSFNSAYNGTNSIAKGTSSTNYLLTGTTHRWYINSGLTIASSFTPTEIMRLNSTGLSLGATYATYSLAPTNGVIIEGSVGIGTTTPQSKLDIEGGVAIGVTYSGTMAAPTNGVIIEGNTGIGTATPATLLDVYGGSLGGTTGNTVDISQLGMPTTNVMQLKTFGIRTATGTTWREASMRQQLTVDAVSGMGYIQYHGFAASDNLPALSFGTINSGATAPLSVPERMVITNTGNVGIGTSAPLSTLEISGTSGELITVSSAGTLTLGASVVYNFSGTTTTWTLPAISTTLNRVYKVKNRGSGNITLNRAGSDNIYNTSSVTTITITPGQACELRNDGSFWVVYNLN